MSENHTPGPWLVAPYYYETPEDDPHFLVGTGQFDTVAEVRHGHADIPGSVEANARLIAAAPELLAVMLEVFDNPKFAVTIGGNPVMVEELMARAFAVIAKVSPAPRSHAPADAATTSAIEAGAGNGDSVR